MNIKMVHVMEGVSTKKASDIVVICGPKKGHL
ncbi:uncharacterized protein METZ01_LOCUS453638, partial [marine metagenome]